MSFPKPDVGNSEQNAFVQGWLEKFADLPTTEPMERHVITAIIESIQELYNPNDHDYRRYSSDQRLEDWVVRFDRMPRQAQEMLLKALQLVHSTENTELIYKDGGEPGYIDQTDLVETGKKMAALADVWDRG